MNLGRGSADPDLLLGLESSVLEVRTLVGGAVAVLAISGEVDIVTAPDVNAIVDAMIERGHNRLIVDMDGLRFVDLRGLQVLLRASNRLTESGGSLVVSRPSPIARRLLNLTGLDRNLCIEDGTPPMLEVLSRQVANPFGG